MEGSLFAKINNKLWRFWPMLLVLFIAWLACNLGCRSNPPLTFAVSRSSTGQPSFAFDDQSWNTVGNSVFPIRIINHSVKQAEEEAWIINCVDRQKFRLKTLEYGTVPPGWVEKKQAKRIVDDNFYQINNGDFFSKTEAGNYQFLSNHDYFYRAEHHQLYKNPQ
jgi:hypothetical protein